MDKDLVRFIRYLDVERNYSKHTIKNYSIDIDNFLNYCKENKFDKYNVKYSNVKKYLIVLYELKYSNATISRKISSLRTFYDYLYDNNLVTNNIFNYISSPKKEKKLPKYISNEDVSIIFDIPDIKTPIGMRNRLIIELLYGTGIRVSELCNIKISDIDLKNKSIRILGKGSKERIVYFGDICLRILNSYIKDARCELLRNKSNDYLIVGAYKKDKKISVRSVELIINEIIRLAAIKKNISPHTFRHTFATHLLNEGCDILIVKELLGHSSLDTTGIYTHVSNERLRNVYLKSHPREKNT